MYSIPRLGTWNQPAQTQTAATAIKIPIPPWPGDPKSSGGLPFLYTLDSQGLPSWTKGGGATTHVTQFGYSSGTTAHTCYFMRPLNYAIVSTAGAKNSTSLIIDKDPGVYSTNWRYGPTTPVNLADNPIATNDYFAVQLADGTWFFDKVAGVSGSTAITVTTTTTIPNVNGNSIPVGNAFFWFGIQTDTDPATGFGHPQIQPPIPASNTLYTGFGDPAGDGIVSTLRPGDPMYYFDANGTAAGIVCVLSGFYGKV